MKSVRG